MKIVLCQRNGCEDSTSFWFLVIEDRPGLQTFDDKAESIWADAAVFRRNPDFKVSGQDERTGKFPPEVLEKLRLIKEEGWIPWMVEVIHRPSDIPARLWQAARKNL